MGKEKEFLEFVVKNLVKNIDSINIEVQEDELGTLLVLRVGKEDMGVLIGRSGNTINAIRTILKAMGLKNGKRINLKVLD